MSLLTQAQTTLQSQSRPTSYTPISLDEIELYLAYLEGRVTFSQVRVALGRSYGYATNWCRRVTDWLFLQGKLQIAHKNQQIVYKEREYHPSSRLFRREIA